MKHFNGNLLCVLDTETTGLDVNKHEMVELCLLPVKNDLKPDISRVFNITIAPTDLNSVDPESLKVRGQTYDDLFAGTPAPAAMDLLDSWIERLNLGPKRIMLLGHNLAFDVPFVKKFMGPLSYDLVFDSRLRDTLTIAQFINDTDEVNQKRHMFPRQALTNMVGYLKLEADDRKYHTALYDCIKTLECYRKLVFHVNHTLER